MNRGLFILLDGPDDLYVVRQVDLLKNAILQQKRSVAVIHEPALHQMSNPIDPKLSYADHLSLLTNVHNRVKNLLDTGIDCIVSHSPIKSIVLFHHISDSPLDYMFINSTLQNIHMAIPPDVQIILHDPNEQTALSQAYLYEAQIRGVPCIATTHNQDDITSTILAHLSYSREALSISPSDIRRDVRVPLSKLVEKEGIPMNNDKFKKVNGDIIRTDEGIEWLEKVTTNADAPVYAISEELGQIASAAAMARLSRRSGDLRDTLLEEFSNIDTKNDINVLRRIISDYGDDSVTQLIGVHYVVEGASNLLTKHIEWGRLAAYLEQSTRYIYYDKKDHEGKYLYLRPPGIEEKVLIGYETIMDKIFDNYSVVVRGITEYLQKKLVKPDELSTVAWNNVVRGQACDAARPMLPVATKSTVGVFASGQALENMIMRLRSSDLPEAKETAEKILEETRKIIPVFLERTDKENRGNAYTKYIADNRHNMTELADDILPRSYDITFKKGPTMTDYSPKNELELTAHMLYEYTDMSEEQLSDFVRTLSYDEKHKILQTYVGERRNRRHKPGRALERATYSWDILCDYGSFRDLQRHRVVSDLTWQKLTPRYGYDVPELVQEAELTDSYLEAFDISLELHSLLQAAGYDEESQYATLLGHNMRWKVTMNAREAMHFIELRTSAQGHPGYRKIVKEMFDQLAAVHPLMADTMTFINRQDSPELTRLEEEKRNDKKRSQGG